jgi:hypothetical protein
LADLSPSSKANAGSIFYARRNFRVNRALAQQTALAFALQAGICNNVAGSLAGWTCARNAEKSLLIANLAASVA